MTIVDKLGLKVRKETSTTVFVEISKDRLECALHQLDLVIGGELDDDEHRDLKDLVDALEEALK